MRNHRIPACARPCRTPFAALLVAFAALPAVPALSDEPTELEDMVITPQRDPLEESRERMLERFRESTPCLGCDFAPLPARQTLAEQLMRYVLLLPAEPPDPDFETRRDLRIANDWRIPERGPNWD